jgi:tetratricopeptide (TPR) repeat protein/DNA-binding SARP family transcriptional activator
MEFRLLGPFEAWHNGKKVALGDPQQRFVLVILLLNAGRPVSGERLSAIIWRDQQPRTNLVPGYISKIRQMLRAAGSVRINSEQTGYVLELGTATLDIVRFADLTRQAAAAVRADDPRTAVALLHEAVDLWRGDFLEDLDVDRVGGPDVGPSESELIDAVCDLSELELAEGNHRWVRTTVRPLWRKHREHLGLTVLLIRALLAGGDRVGAIKVYGEAVQELREFGIAIPVELRDLARLAQADARKNTLPHCPNGFTDRAEPLRQLTQLVADPAHRLVWVSGPPGVGKTTFAVKAAHDLSGSFPDGTLFVPLNGFTLNVDPLGPADALAVLLRDLGVPDERIPASAVDRAVLYQERLAGSRTLIVLDNAASDEQVQPLLPNSPDCFAVVTSRRDSRLLDGGRPIRLTPFTARDGADQFRGLVDPRRLAGAAADVDRIVAGCGGLPLHIRLMAALFNRHQAWPIDHLAALLEERVPWRADADADAVSAILVSYNHLDAEQRTMFRLCGLVPGTDLDLRAAAALADCTVGRARVLLDGLHSVGMLEETETERYSMLDPLKEFARSVPVDGIDSVDLTGDALNRLLDFLLVSARAAMATAFPFADDQLPVLTRSSPHGRTFTDRENALGWLTTERANLVTTVGYAATHDRPEHTWQLAVLLWRFLYTTGRLQDWVETLTAARQVMAREPDSPGYAQVLLRLSAAYWQTGRLAQALEVAAQALPKWIALGDALGEADTLCAIAAVSADLGEPQEAVAHLEAALVKYAGIGDQRGQANALGMLGHLSQQRGNFELAVSQQQEAAALLEAIGNRQGLAHTLDNLGSAQQHLGDLEQAMDNHERAHDLATEIGDDAVAAYALDNLGNIRRRQGRLDTAMGFHERALAIAEPLGDPNLTTSIRLHLAETSLARGDRVAAAGSWRAAERLARETGDLGKLALARHGLARTLHQQGQHDTAAEYWALAESGFRETRMPQVDEVRRERAELTCACTATPPPPP